MRTNDEVKAAIEKVKANRDERPQYGMFGDDNYEAADAALDVLENLITSEDEIYDKEFNSYTEGEAIAAVQWLNGEIEMDEWLD